MYGAQLIEALRRAHARKATTTHVGTAAPGCPRVEDPVLSADTLRKPSRATLDGQPGAAVPTKDLEFFGVGGPLMRAAGCSTIVDAKDLAVVGITEILSHLPKIYSLYRKLIHEADKTKPDLAIVIDSPAFNWRVARAMKKRKIPTVYYVAPQFWAWRQGRVRLLRDYIDKAFVIFPFEENFYRERGVDATFIGHPLADLPHPTITREDYAAQHHLDKTSQWITLMPGSRRKEVRMNLPTILDAAALLGSNLGYKYEFLLPVAPTLEKASLQNMIDHHKCAKPKIKLVPESLPALYHSRAGIVASGTATVEAAMMNTPFVMVYRVSPLTYMLGKPRVKIPHFAMVNLIAGKEIVPELVQHDFTAQNVATHINKIIPDGPARQQMLAGLAQVKASLYAPQTGDDSRTPADRAAEIILDLMNSSASRN
jgi:lipid-A-disaccharide synthase